MSNREFTAQRTMLANAFATAGAELLEYMGTSAALAAIPSAEPPRYVVAGTLAEIVKLLPAAEVIRPPLSAAEKPTGDLTPVTALTGEQLLKFYVEAHGGVDEGLVAVANAAIAAHLERLAQASEKHLPGWERGIATVSLTGHQLRAALDLINPDGNEDADQLDDWLTFGIVQHKDDDGTVATGMCCWNDDTDGVLPLDGEYTAAPASQEGAHAALDEVRNQALEEAALAAEKVQDEYRESQSGKWPELRDDAATGAGDCVEAIRALKTPASAEKGGA